MLNLLFIYSCICLLYFLFLPYLFYLPVSYYYSSACEQSSSLVLPTYLPLLPSPYNACLLYLACLYIKQFTTLFWCIPAFVNVPIPIQFLDKNDGRGGEHEGDAPLRA